MVIGKNSPVVVDGSLVGVVEYVGKRSSRVRLITDSGLISSVRALRGSFQDNNLAKTSKLLFDMVNLREDLFKTKKEPAAVVKKMQKKSNAGISDEQAADISRFLEAPYWQQPLIRGKCIGCHPLNTIYEKCGAEPFSTGISQETIKLMKKRGADITDKEVIEVLKILQW